MLPEIGKIIQGKVTGITNFGAFVSLGDGVSGMVHISEISDEYVRDIHSCLKEGQEVAVKVISVDERGRIALSIRKAAAELEKRRIEAGQPAEFSTRSHKSGATDGGFEDMMSRFRTESDEKIAELKHSFDSKRPGAGFNRRGKS